MFQFRKPHVSLSLTVLLLAQPAFAAEPQFVDWVSINTIAGVAEGTVGSIGVSLAGSPFQGGGNVDGSSALFSGTDFTPPLAASDALELASYTIPSNYTLTFSQAISNPVFHILDLSSRITFAGNALTRLSGNIFFTVTGDSVDGAGFAGTGAGTVQLNGTYTSVSFSAVDLFQTPPGGDGFYLQVGVSPVPEPSNLALLLFGLVAVGKGRHILARALAS